MFPYETWCMDFVVLPLTGFIVLLSLPLYWILHSFAREGGQTQERQERQEGRKERSSRCGKSKQQSVYGMVIKTTTTVHDVWITEEEERRRRRW